MTPPKSRLGALRTFEAAARHASITKAAKELSVTPGAVSQQVRELEKALGVELFVRRSGKLALTEGGRHLAARLGAAFDQIERAVIDVAGDPGSRRLRLKVTPTFAIRWLVPRLTQFYEQHPEFEIEVGTYPRQEEADVEDVDFVVRHGRGGWEDAESEAIFPDALAPVCSPALAKKLREPADLAAHNLLHSMMRADGWELWLSAQGVAGLRPRKVTKLANAAVTYQAALDGMGIALAQLAYVAGDLADGKLVMPFRRVLRTGSGYHLVYARHKANRPNIRLFRQWIQSVPKDEPAPSR
jgi:LysR family glycine cleavage system transcriptional activator